MEPNVFSHVIRWLLERIEHFPIPLEEALWAYAYCISGPPGHESFSFPLPSCSGGGAVIRDEDGTPRQDRGQIMDHDPKSQGSAAVPPPPSPYDGATSLSCSSPR